MSSTTTEDRMQFAESDPRHLTIKLKKRLEDAAESVREDVEKADDPKARALFVLGGLTQAFRDYEQKASPLGGSARVRP